MKLNRILNAFCLVVVFIFVLVLVSVLVKEHRERAVEDSGEQVIDSPPAVTEQVIEPVDVPEEVVLTPHSVESVDIVEVPTEDEVMSTYEQFKQFTETYEIHFVPSKTIDVDDPNLNNDLGFWAVSYPMDWKVVSSLLCQYAEIYGVSIAEFSITEDSYDDSKWDDLTLCVYTSGAKLELHYTYTGEDWAGCLKDIVYD